MLRLTCVEFWIIVLILQHDVLGREDLLLVLVAPGILVLHNRENSVIRLPLASHQASSPPSHAVFLSFSQFSLPEIRRASRSLIALI